MREATFTMTDDEMRTAMADLDRPYRVRLGWLYHRLHRWAHRYGGHDWLVGNRFYRWWGEQRYGPSRTQEAAADMARAIDAAVLRAVLRGMERP